MNKKYILASLAATVALTANAQNIKVKGTVVDSNNEPIIGAYVKVKGSTKGVVTDIDGNYTIDADKNATLQVSYVGMANQDIKVGSRNQINIVLKENANDLNEVVVIGYGQVKKSDLTSSISAIKGEKLEKLSTGNVMNALQGQVSSPSEPGEDFFVVYVYIDYRSKPSKAGAVIHFMFFSNCATLLAPTSTLVMPG